MPDKPSKPNDSWNPEVDRLLRKLHPEAVASVAPQSQATVPPRQLRRPRPLGPKPRLPAEPPTFWLPTRAGVWARVAAGAALAIGLTQWPYARCGFPLAGYFLAVAVALVAGAWVAYAAWRRRMGVAHIAAISVIFLAAGLVALEILPRIGYAAVALSWGCPS